MTYQSNVHGQGDHTARAILSQTPLGDVWEERDRQDAKWGEQNHPLSVWSLVLGEEVGELCQAILWHREAAGNGHHESAASSLIHARKEAVQVAAVAVAIIEFIDRHPGYEEASQ